jgi:hypothetical protein
LGLPTRRQIDHSAGGRRWHFAIVDVLAFVLIGVVAPKRPREATAASTAAAPIAAPTAVLAKPFLIIAPACAGLASRRPSSADQVNR